MGLTACVLIVTVLLCFNHPVSAADKDVANPSRAWLCPSADLIGPCTCDPNFVSIMCDAALFKSASEIQSIFTQPFPNSTMNMFTINNLHFPLTNNLLVDKQAKRIYLECESKFRLSIDSETFTSTSAVLYLVDIFNCDVSDFSFLNPLPEVTILYIRYAAVGDFNGFPLVPKLHSLFITNTSIGSWYDTGLTPSLTNVSLSFMEPSVVTKLLPRLTDFNLGYLQLVSNRLTEIPPELQTFPALRDLQLWANEITSLRSGDLAPSSNLELLSLDNCPIRTIERGFFQGDYSGTTLQLDFTQLSTLDRDVFYPLLDAMANGPGHIEMHGTLLGCGCDLSWLIRDSRQFLPDIVGAQCVDGAKIEDLDPNAYINC